MGGYPTATLLRSSRVLTHTAQHGVVQNARKFVWGKRDIEYVGFLVTSDGVHPSDETHAAITNFPRPTDITGVRSWFSLVEQVSFAFAKTELMSPFKPLLKKDSTFAWSQQLQDAFDKAKVEIVAIVKKGVKPSKWENGHVSSPTGAESESASSSGRRSALAPTYNLRVASTAGPWYSTGAGTVLPQKVGITPSKVSS